MVLPLFAPTGSWYRWAQDRSASTEVTTFGDFGSSFDVQPPAGATSNTTGCQTVPQAFGEAPRRRWHVVGHAG